MWKQKAGLRRRIPRLSSLKTLAVDIASVRPHRTNAAAVELHLSPIALQLKGISSAMDKPIGVDLSVSITG